MMFRIEMITIETFVNIVDDFQGVCIAIILTKKDRQEAVCELEICNISL